MQPNTAIGDLMTTELITIGPKDLLEKVKTIFDNYTFRHLPVVDANQRLLGLISKSDFVKISHALTIFNSEKFEPYNQRLLQTILVEEVMTTNLFKLQPEDPLALAIDIFLENHFHAIPIVQEDQLIGLLSPNDILANLKEVQMGQVNII
ncbi:MAG: CBS domain-containing protein [Bacteroidota bacterium]